MKIYIPKPLKEYRAEKHAKKWKSLYSAMYIEVGILIDQYGYHLDKQQQRTIAYNLATRAMDETK